jgi:nicotinamidase-related amidase
MKCLKSLLMTFGLSAGVLAQAQSDSLPQPRPLREQWVTVDDSLALFERYKKDRPLAYFNQYTQKALETDTAPVGDAANIAFLVVDAQAMYCSMKYHGNFQTERVCARLQTIVPDFRKASIDVYNVSYSLPLTGKKKESFYIYQPDVTDAFIAKTEDSAFEGSEIHAALIDDNKKLLIVTGVNLSACIRETVLDARKLGYEVYLPLDLVGNNDGDYLANADILEMKYHGVHITHSQDLIKRLRPALAP